MRFCTLSLHSTRIAFVVISTALSLFIFLILPPTLHAANVSLTWNPNNESDLAGYRIYQRTLPSTDYGFPIFSGLPSNPSAPQLIVTNLIEGTSYGFIATAFDSAGNESGPSTEKQTTVAAPEIQSTPVIEEPVALDTTELQNPPLGEEQVSTATSVSENPSTTEEAPMPLATTENESPPSLEKQTTVAASENQSVSGTEEPIAPVTTEAESPTMEREQISASTAGQETTSATDEEQMAFDITGNESVAEEEEIDGSIDQNALTTEKPTAPGITGSEKSSSEKESLVQNTSEKAHTHSNKKDSPLMPPCPSNSPGPPGHNKIDGRAHTNCGNNEKATAHTDQIHKPSSN